VYVVCCQHSQLSRGIDTVSAETFSRHF
jgi:hypothetical protein